MTWHRKFYLTRGSIHADTTAIMIQDYNRETANFWVIEIDNPPSRHNISKDPQRHVYFDTWEEAHAALSQWAQEDVRACVQAGIRAQSTVDLIGKMTRPN